MRPPVKRLCPARQTKQFGGGPQPGTATVDAEMFLCAQFGLRPGAAADEQTAQGHERTGDARENAGVDAVTGSPASAWTTSSPAGDSCAGAFSAVVSGAFDSSAGASSAGTSGAGTSRTSSADGTVGAESELPTAAEPRDTTAAEPIDAEPIEPTAADPTEPTALEPSDEDPSEDEPLDGDEALPLDEEDPRLPRIAAPMAQAPPAIAGDSCAMAAGATAAPLMRATPVATATALTRNFPVERMFPFTSSKMNHGNLHTKNAPPTIPRRRPGLFAPLFHPSFPGSHIPTNQALCGSSTNVTRLSAKFEIQPPTLI